jgi:DNA-binding MarR family transcriptional regulator
MVHTMNKKALLSLDDYTVFRLLCELDKGDVGSQRDLARRLQSALGLVNGYLKVCSDKGWVRVRDLSSNRKSYQLTAKGGAERRRLALLHARYLDDIIAVIQQEYCQIAAQLREEGVERVAFCGVDGGAGIAWLAMQQAGLELSLAMDTCGVGERFMGTEVVSLAYGLLGETHRIVISSQQRAAELKAALLELGAKPEIILVPACFLELPYAAC